MLPLRYPGQPCKQRENDEVPIVIGFYYLSMFLVINSADKDMKPNHFFVVIFFIVGGGGVGSLWPSKQVMSSWSLPLHCS